MFEHSFLDLITVQWLLVYSMSGFAQIILCQVYTSLVKGFLAAFTRPTIVWSFLTPLFFNAADKRILNHLAEDVSESLGTHSFER